MNRFAFAVAGVLVLFPSLARGALSLQIGPMRGATTPDAVLRPGEEGFFDLIFNETGPRENEELLMYELLVRAPRPGITLLRAERPDNWVFTAPDATFTVKDAAAEHVAIEAINTLVGALSDITQGARAARIYFRVDPAPAGPFSLVLDGDYTHFWIGKPSGGRDDEGSSIIPIDVSDRGVVLTPEPSGLALLGLVGAAALRRNRGRSDEGAEPRVKRS